MFALQIGHVTNRLLHSEMEHQNWQTSSSIALWGRVYNNIILLKHSWNTGGEPELIIVTYAAVPAASDVSALLVCTALHEQITHRHCSKFSPWLI